MSQVSVPEQIEQYLARLRQGDEKACDELLALACDWLRRLTHLMLRGYPGVSRWEDTNDVMQNALLRLDRALRHVRPQTAREFSGLATLQIRRELIDLARHYYGPQGLGANYASQASPEAPQTIPRPALDPSDPSHNPDRLNAWTAFHDAVAALPSDEREVFEARWYQNLSNAEAATLLGISVSTVIRRYQSACRKLHDEFHGELPFS